MSAKEMFEDLGYTLEKDLWIDKWGNKNLIYRSKNNKYNTIRFNLQNKEIIAIPMSFKVIPAINKQVEELGWNE